jgi:ubiquinone/menaquinone biosynthesis C-methylase UbiE
MNMKKQQTDLSCWSLNQKNHYNIAAESFEQGIFFRRNNRNHYKKIDKICELLELQDHDCSVLEVGVGTGIHAIRLLKSHPAVGYTGVDLSDKMLKQAKHAFTQLDVSMKSALIVGDGSRLPFKDDSFDAAYISGSLHHFPDPQLGLIELFRVVKPGGSLAIMEPNWLFPTNFLAGLLNNVERNILKMSRQNLERWGSDLGIEDLRTINYIYTPPLPTFLTGFCDVIDDLFSRIPWISNISIMICLVGKKGKSS